MSAQSTEHIRGRRSVRRYQPDPIPQMVILDILDCGRLAPSAHNRQPWVLGAVTDAILLARLADLVENARFIHQCKVCFAVFTRSEEPFHLEDGCAAAMNIIHASSAHGVATCWVAGAGKAYADDVRELLEVPCQYTLVALVAAGYPDQDTGVNKRPMEEVIFLDRYKGGEGRDQIRNKKAEVSPVREMKWAVRRLLLKWF